MTFDPAQLDKKVKEAVRYFWARRAAQAQKQGTAGGTRDPWERYFKVFPEFKNASYVQRYDVLLTRLVRERLYDATCFLLYDSQKGPKGAYREPNPELSFSNFITSLLGRAFAITKSK